MACPYAEIFGRPGTGAHALRLPVPGIPNGLALVDLGLTLGAAWAVSSSTGMRLLTALVLLMLGTILHRALRVDTALNVMFFGLSEPCIPHE